MIYTSWRCAAEAGAGDCHCLLGFRPQGRVEWFPTRAPPRWNSWQWCSVRLHPPQLSPACSQQQRSSGWGVCYHFYTKINTNIMHVHLLKVGCPPIVSGQVCSFVLFSGQSHLMSWKSRKQHNSKLVWRHLTVKSQRLYCQTLQTQLSKWDSQD